MHKILGILFGFWLGGLGLALGADTYQLTNGTSLAGDVVKYDDNGILLRTPEDVYTNVTWTTFSQGALKQLAQNPKIRPFVKPFIIVPLSERRPPEVINLHKVSRLERPPAVPLLAALFSSSVGLVVMFLIYGANLYAGMEIAIYRARPIGVVMGAAAVLPILGPIIFLSLPTRTAPGTEQAAAPEAAPETMAVPGGVPTSALVQPPGGIRIAAASWQKAPSTEKPAPQIFRRGEFMFNRRFFETKFAVFFNLIRREAENKDMVLLVKTVRGLFEVERITRIAANDMHIEVLHGALRQEVIVPFAEIQEVQLKQKDT